MDGAADDDRERERERETVKRQSGYCKYDQERDEEGKGGCQIRIHHRLLHGFITLVVIWMWYMIDTKVDK